MPGTVIAARALQIAERIDLKGLERSDQFSSTPLGFRVASGGAVILFKFGVAVFFGLNPLEEEMAVDGLGRRLVEPISDRESETVQLVIRAEGEDQPILGGAIELKNDAPERLLLVAEALAVSVALAHDERRIASSFDRIEKIASGLKSGTLGVGSRGSLLEHIGEALLIRQRLAGRVDMADRPDVLWDNPSLERLWVRLADEFDLAPRARAIGQKLDVIRDTAETMGDMLATRTSHRLEWYIIILIAIEILLGLADRIGA